MNLKLRLYAEKTLDNKLSHIKLKSAEARYETSFLTLFQINAIGYLSSRGKLEYKKGRKIAP